MEEEEIDEDEKAMRAAAKAKPQAPIEAEKPQPDHMKHARKLEGWTEDFDDGPVGMDGIKNDGIGEAMASFLAQKKANLVTAREAREAAKEAAKEAELTAMAAEKMLAPTNGTAVASSEVAATSVADEPLCPSMVATMSTAPMAAAPPVEDALLSGWSAVVDPSSGKTYYVNVSSGQSSWERPVETPPPAPAPPEPVPPEPSQAAAADNASLVSAALGDASLMGKHVRIKGLTTKSELNGRLGTVVGFDSEHNRHRVKLGNKVMAFRAANLDVG